MVDWNRFISSNFEYDFEQDKLALHRVTFEEAAYMSGTKPAKKPKLSQKELDQRVIAQAENDSAWEKPVRVKRVRGTSLSIPGDLAARAAFLAKLHRETHLDQWLTRIIRERVELEEVAYLETKRELTSRGGA